ncbi:transposase [bacterium]|nr:transposase [bacterium]
MPYRYLQFLSGYYYHVFNRGVFREKVFIHEEHYLYALSLLRKNLKRFKLTLIAYCLMPNHYHFLIRPEQDHVLSKCIGYTFNAYSQSVNKGLKRNGPLFQGPFKAKLIDRQEVLMHLCRYIHLNPVEAGLTSKPEEWPFSNYLEWIGLRKCSLFDEDFRCRYFRDGSGYRKFVMEDMALPVSFKGYMKED